MILECIRSVKDALANVTYGVNVKIASLDLDSGDSAPPSIALIADETRNGFIARSQIPPTTPCLMVSLAEDVELEPEIMQTKRDGEVTILIRLVLNDIDTEDGTRDALYLLRAVEMTLREFHKNDNVADRVRNGVQIGPCIGMRHVSVYQPVEDKVIVAGLVLRYECRDTTP